MNKYDIVIQTLEKDISLIKNKNDHELSVDALKGHRSRYVDQIKLICQLKKGKVLDIGASPYHLTYCLNKLSFDIRGVDINPNILKDFQRKHGLKVIKHNM